MQRTENTTQVSEFYETSDMGMGLAVNCIRVLELVARLIVLGVGR
jgi:hypothetical protein